ncbi:MAG: pro-sigmaK processing inhibitor BofA family protein [Methanomicrobiaceae archaeon]|uniref:SigmaK-factor processing regulatory BofA n=1 Tax=hydrocarbon metagenome TaxID=938273 RepID=A0A0W8FH52_9ZZZZ|nr:pro-sigmaK processing inhibitor BofA family protein [Methanomicrobiaceae archaeon]MDD5418326.1 pro-sigmaK processing inhibitor BofA family protein [Methanomicrobiaceae archaeon]
MIEALLVIVLAVAIAAVIYYLLRKGVVLVINAAVGLLTLFLLNTFEVMSMVGAPDIPITLTTVIVCAFGGLPGAIVLVLLHLFGITL